MIGSRKLRYGYCGSNTQVVASEAAHALATRRAYERPRDQAVLADRETESKSCYFCGKQSLYRRVLRRADDGKFCGIGACSSHVKEMQGLAFVPGSIPVVRKS